MPYLNIAGYYFYKPKVKLPVLQKKLREECSRLNIRGTVLLAKEGINVFLAGQEKSIQTIKQWIQDETGNPEFQFKESWCEAMPFKRLRVKIKPQIISFRARGINPLKSRAPSIQPETLKEWLDQKKDFVLLDTRNRYEVELGSFERADHLNIRSFNLYEEQAKKMPEDLKDKTLVMFCTGGIRCEKAAPFMQKMGFKNVLQLEGGILNYFEKTGGQHYRGDCFVFDERVALTPNLEETKVILCSRCGHKVSPSERRHPEFRFGKYCPHCSPYGKKAKNRLT